MSENQQGLQGPPPEERPHPDGRRNSQGIRIDPEVEAEPDSRTAMISALVEHEPGVLARIAHRRGARTRHRSGEKTARQAQTGHLSRRA
jgi:hypothetical protein